MYNKSKVVQQIHNILTLSHSLLAIKKITLQITSLVVYLTTASEPAKVVGMTAVTLIDAFFEKLYLWDTDTQIHPHSEFLGFRFIQHIDSPAYKFSKVVADVIAQTNTASTSSSLSIKSAAHRRIIITGSGRSSNRLGRQVRKWSSKQLVYNLLWITVCCATNRSDRVWALYSTICRKVIEAAGRECRWCTFTAGDVKDFGFKKVLRILTAIICQWFPDWRTSKAESFRLQC